MIAIPKDKIPNWIKTRKFVAKYATDTTVDMATMWCRGFRADETVGKAAERELCGTTACFGGYVVIANKPRNWKIRDTYTYPEFNYAEEAKKFLGLISAHGIFSNNACGWPRGLQLLYQNGFRKEALLALLDRVIVSGGLDWIESKSKSRP